MSLKLTAPAKINLALHVTGQRHDGYHLLDSLVTFAKAGDVLAFQRSDDLSLKIIGSERAFLQADDNNLVMRAAQVLREKVRRNDLGAAITLEKNLPLASGIGGGSADAAATLHGLTAFWQFNISEQDIMEIGLSLGADVPMCLLGKPCRVGGIGENLEPVSLPSFPIVLANPRVSISTPAVFKSLTNKNNPSLDDLPSDDWIGWLKTQRNDMQATAIALAPSIQSCIDGLSQSKGCSLARMSGSGATCFGLFTKQADADQAAKEIQNDHPDWWVVASSTV